MWRHVRYREEAFQSMFGELVRCCGRECHRFFVLLFDFAAVMLCLVLVIVGALPEVYVLYHGGAFVLVVWVDPSFGRDCIPYNTGSHPSGLSATIVYFTKSSRLWSLWHNGLQQLHNGPLARWHLFRHFLAFAANPICSLVIHNILY